MNQDFKQQQLLAQKFARENLAPYAVSVNPKFQVPAHIDCIIQLLEAIDRGEIKRLMVVCPFRHGKSELVTRIFPAWYHGRHPDHMIMVCAHTQSLADDFGLDIRSNVISEEHQAIFPEYQLSGASQAKHAWRTTAGGKFVSAGVGAGISGKGSHLLVIDDPIKGHEDAGSEVMRAKLHRWYNLDASGRLEPDASVVIVSTRWHELDLIGWLLDTNEQSTIDDWTVVHFPAIAEQDEGWRKEGEALWPERFPLEVLDKVKARLPSQDWLSCYQGRPDDIEGNLFMRSWWKYFDWDPLLAARRDEFVRVFTKPYRVIQSWDTGLEEGKENDFSVCITALETDSGIYIVDVFRQKLQTPALIDAAVDLCLMWRPDAILIEDSTAGKSFIHQLMVNPRTKHLPILPIVPKGEKLVRAKAITPYVASGGVFVPRNAIWLKPLINECAAFPSAAHDDQVDALSQLVNWAKLSLDRIQEISAELDVDVQLNHMAV